MQVVDPVIPISALTSFDQMMPVEVKIEPQNVKGWYVLLHMIAFLINISYLSFDHTHIFMYRCLLSKVKSKVYYIYNDLYVQ